jgi:ADP-ribose pyrophosphatase YjhB (NUDIX family)
MPLIDEWTHDGQSYRFEWFDGNAVEKFNPYTQCYGLCIDVDSGLLVIGRHPPRMNWTLPGGSREEGESAEETLRRELDEELSLELVDCELLGAQRVFYLSENREPHFQLRYACLVKLKELTPDPDISLLWERKLIPIEDVTRYIPWGPILTHLATLTRDYEKKKCQNQNTAYLNARKKRGA